MIDEAVVSIYITREIERLRRELSQTDSEDYAEACRRMIRKLGGRVPAYVGRDVTS